MSLVRGEYYLDIAEGKVKGKRVLNVFGKNPSVSTANFSAIWDSGGEYTGFNATVAETVTIVSSDVNDTLLGAGARTIRIQGLDGSYNEQTEDVEMDGTTPVVSIGEYIRLPVVKVLTSGGGTFGSNLGSITIGQSITTVNVFAVVPIGYGSSMVTAYTVPAGKTCYILAQSAAIANKQSAVVEVRIKVKQPGSVFTVSGEAALNSQGAGFIERKFVSPAPLPALTDFFIEAEASTAVAVSAFLTLLIVDD